MKLQIKTSPIFIDLTSLTCETVEKEFSNKYQKLDGLVNNEEL